MKKTTWNNDGILFPDPGKLKEARCGVCSKKMNVERNVVGPTSFVAAMSGRKRVHDMFICPDYSALWHKHAADLKGEIRITKSRKVRKILKGEMQETVRTKKIPEESCFLKNL